MVRQDMKMLVKALQYQYWQDRSVCASSVRRTDDDKEAREGQDNMVQDLKSKSSRTRSSYVIEHRPIFSEKPHVLRKSLDGTYNELSLQNGPQIAERSF